MSEFSKAAPVHCWEEQIILPTYPVQPADLNPMFLEKRVYQGSSGKVYPNPFTDRVALEKEDRPYHAVFLENEFIQLMILPQIGGRIHAGFDKTAQYDFFYRQHVIKPALVGLLGPWISGGVEFNWPQHHRPSTYMPVHHAIEEHPDGARTLWLSEHDPMLRMKGMVGIHLAPGKSIVEARVRLYNRTPLPQTFLWWANVAVRVHDQYQAFFPPDVTFVADHAKRAVSSYPIARNPYYGVDYRPGTDISWYKNIPVPTSYMVTESRYDFCGGYDHAHQAGLVHTSNHHVAPGKKLWTWGNADFGYAWDRNLTDSDGPYVELMAGAYTDNQPDFSWLQPYETRTFSQFWYPIQQIGPAKNANTQAALNLEFAAGKASIGVCVTSRRSIRILLTQAAQSIFDQTLEITPGRPFTCTVDAPAEPAHYRLQLLDENNAEILAWQPENQQEKPLPDPATEPPPPEQIASNEELYLTGLHLEQYRHATRSPETYWLEGLRRDPDDVRLNNAVGLAHLRRGQFVQAEEHFTRAIRRLIRLNPNPRDGEPHYNLGLTLLYQGKTAGSYDAFHKAVWNQPWQGPGYYALASISTARGNLTLALEQIHRSLGASPSSLNSLGLKASLLRLLGRPNEAGTLIDATLVQDPLAFRLIVERFFLTNDPNHLAALVADLQTLLDITFELAASGLTIDAQTLLEAAASLAPNHPMLHYTRSWLAAQLSQPGQSIQQAAQAEAAPPDYCFPARLEEMIVLEDAIRRNPSAAKAHYYLGNLYYDKRRYPEAIACWRKSVDIDPTFSIPWRNLGIAEFNILHNPLAADKMYARAFAANPADARLLYEHDQLKKRARLATPQARLKILQAHSTLVALRDDLTVELITLLNQASQHQTALDQLAARRFSPWEGGEGLVSGQFVHAHRALGLAALIAQDPADALEHFTAARHYPHNLGEGKHLLTLERDLDYFSALATQQLNGAQLACQHLQNAAAPLPAPSHYSYFQAQALKSLGNTEAAHEILVALAAHAQNLVTTPPKIDYFATSLPNMLLFDDDLAQRNRIESLLLAALASHGLGDAQPAINQLQQLLTEDPNHLFAAQMLGWIQSDRKVQP